MTVSALKIILDSDALHISTAEIALCAKKLNIELLELALFCIEDVDLAGGILNYEHQ